MMVPFHQAKWIFISSDARGGGRLASVIGAALALLLVSIAMGGVSYAQSAPALRIPFNHPSDLSWLMANTVSSKRQLTLRISLRLRHRAELKKLLREQQDPSSPEYHQWLKPEEFATRFGPSPQDVAAIKQWLSDKGFKIIGGNATVLRVRGTVGMAAKAFAVSFLGSTNGHFYANREDPAIPARFAALVTSIQGLDNLVAAKPAGDRTSSGISSGASSDASPAGTMLASLLNPDQFRFGQFSSEPQTNYQGIYAFGPSDLYTFYDENALLNNGTGGNAGSCVAVIEDSDFSTAAVDMFDTTFSLPPVNLTKVMVDNGTNPGYNGDEGEALLDVEWGHAVAPDAPIRAYIGNGVQGLVDAMTSAVQQNACGSIDISFSFCGASSSLYTQTLNQIFSQAAAQGQSIFVASGDQGAAGLAYSSKTNSCVPGSTRHVSEMAADPYVTAVGGTQFNPNYDSAGDDVGYVTENVWDESVNQNGKTVPLGASGGGPSHIFSKPAYQAGEGVPNDGKRDVPDVSIASGILKPGFFLGDDPSQSGGATMDCCWGGTSIGAAMWAGIANLIGQVEVGNGSSDRIGNINPRIYLMGQQMNGSATGFRDVTVGNNSFHGVTGFPATAGYDRSSGWGTVDLGVFVPAFVTGNFVTVAGNLKARPYPRRFPHQLFSSVGTTSPVRKVFIVNRNRVNLPAAIDSASASGDFNIVSNGCTPTLAARSRCEIDLTFQPSAVGLRTGTLTVSGHFQNSPLQVQLLGKAIPPHLVYGPKRLHLGKQPVGTTSAAGTVRLINRSDVPIDVSSIASSSPDFVASATCVGALAPQGGECDISVTFTPSVQGLERATLAITDDARGTTQIVHMVGRGM